MNSVIAADVNSLLQTTGGTIVSPVYVGTVSTSLQYVVPQPTTTPPPKRRLTGKPKGKTEEQQNENIRKRVSYRWIVQEAQYFRSKGVPLHSISVVMKYIIELRCSYKGGFAYNSNRHWARQSLYLFLGDIKDHKMVEELKLN